MTIVTDPRRLFTLEQKTKLFNRARGICEKCHQELDPEDWHAHHVVPHKDGGQTHIDNGQALCVDCHKFIHRESIDKDIYPSFRKDYSWQERAIQTYIDGENLYYSATREIQQAYVVEVSPSGGKTIFSMKLALEMINKDLIDRVVWIVPRESIKMGFVDDSKKAGNVTETKRKELGGCYLAIEADAHSSQLGHLKNHHGTVLTYQALTPATLEYFDLLSRKHRLLFVFDEAHHGADGPDNAMNTWGLNMLKIAQIACSIVAMTGTPVRADDKRIPFLNYSEEEEIDVMGTPRIAIKVEPSFKFTYRQAVQAGVARRIMCLNVDPEIEYSKNRDDHVTIKKMPLSQIPAGDLKYVQYTPLDKDDGIIDDMLKKAYEEIQRMRRNGDSDAACLVTVQRNSKRVSDALNHVSDRINSLFNITPISVESAYGDEARVAIKRFKQGKEEFIVSKEMVSEGTNLPRIRVVCILRNIGNSTFYEQLVHRATRNDADNRPEDAIIIQLTYPNLVEWGATLENDSRLIWLPEEHDGGEGGGGTGEGDAPEIIGLNASLYSENDEVIIGGEDYTDTDPFAKILIDDVSPIGVNRAQLNVILRQMKNKNMDINQNLINSEKHESPQEEFNRKRQYLAKAVSKIAFSSKYEHNEIWNRLKRASNVPLKMSITEISTKHDEPLKAINSMVNALRKIDWTSDDYNSTGENNDD